MMRNGSVTFDLQRESDHHYTNNVTVQLAGEILKARRAGEPGDG